MVAELGEFTFHLDGVQRKSSNYHLFMSPTLNSTWHGVVPKDEILLMLGGQWPWELQAESPGMQC